MSDVQHVVDPCSRFWTMVLTIDLTCDCRVQPLTTVQPSYRFSPYTSSSTQFCSWFHPSLWKQLSSCRKNGENKWVLVKKRFPNTLLWDKIFQEGCLAWNHTINLIISSLGSPSRTHESFLLLILIPTSSILTDRIQYWMRTLVPGQNRVTSSPTLGTRVCIPYWIRPVLSGALI